MLTLRGSDHEAFVRDLARTTDGSAEEAARRSADNAARELRRIVRKNFGTEWRVWDAGSFSKTIRVRMIRKGWFRVYSKAVYTKMRSGRVDLLWVFDQAPVIRSGRGKSGVAVPVKGGAPIANNGRRYAWPSEAEAMGWQLDFAPVQGKDSVVILGRRNRFEDWRPLYIWKPSVKAPKRLDLDALHAKHAAAFDDVWGEVLDRRAARAAARTAMRMAA